MKKFIQESQKGQSLVLVILLLVGLLAILALVLDGGNAYLKRRQAQNAADAGALAGAREFCSDPSASNISNALTTADNYVIKNNALSVAGYPIIDTADYSVTAASEITFNTYFGNILGRSDMTARAIAEAGCFGACLGEGVLPVVWICNTSGIGPLVGDVNVDCVDLPITLDTLDEYLYNPSGATDPVSGQSLCQPITIKGQPKYVCRELTIIIDNLDLDTLQCQSTGGLLDCDFDGDGDDDYISASNRGWADLDGGPGSGYQCDPLEDNGNEGVKELGYWVTEGFDCPFSNHTWVGDQSTNALDLFFEVRKRMNTDPIVVLPIFDDSCPSNPDPSSGDYTGECNWHPGQHPPGDLVHTFPSKENYYHIDRFGVFYITCVQTNKGECPGAEKFYKDNEALFKGKPVEEDPLHGNDYNAVEGYFLRDYVPGLSGKCEFDPLSAFNIYLDK